MNRSIQYLIALLLVVGVAYLLFAYGQQKPISTDVATSTATTVAMRTESVKEQTDTYTIDATYPQFGIPSVDAAIKSTVDAGLNDFRGYPANPPDSSTPKNSFIEQFDHVYQGSDVVSVSLIVSEDTGGAHPNTSIITVNVDPRNGHVLTLDDALALIGKTLQQVSAASLVQLKTMIASEDIFTEGTLPTAENYAIFRVDRDHVTFIFNNYQVAAYAAGPQQATFARIK